LIYSISKSRIRLLLFIEAMWLRIRRSVDIGMESNANYLILLLRLPPLPSKPILLLILLLLTPAHAHFSLFHLLLPSQHNNFCLLLIPRQCVSLNVFFNCSNFYLEEEKLFLIFSPTLEGNVKRRKPLFSDEWREVTELFHHSFVKVGDKSQRGADDEGEQQERSAVDY
jgi:hypothetical protein